MICVSAYEIVRFAAFLSMRENPEGYVFQRLSLGKSKLGRFQVVCVAELNRKTLELRELHESLAEKSYPYGAPPPPKNYAFAGLGWVFGCGCTVGGPFFGVGSGYALKAVGANGWIGLPRLVAVFGGGLGAGAVCGIGFSAGLVAGVGNGYVPIGLWIPFQFAPRFLRLERIFDRWLHDTGREK
jgi:hypothetical protein